MVAQVGPSPALRSVGSSSSLTAQDLYVTQPGADSEDSPALPPGDTPQLSVSPLLLGQAADGMGVDGTSPSGGLRNRLHLADMLNDSGITVKNTFLDFEPRQPAGLRAVHTASGRLDLMG
jgi:hypothetical protein